MADIIYDIDKLKTAKEAIDDLIDNLNDDNKKLTEALADLKAGWKTDTGTKFFDEHKDTWSEYVKKYVKKLNGVSSMLQKAIDRYENIGSEVKNLKV